MYKFETFSKFGAEGGRLQTECWGFSKLRRMKKHAVAPPKAVTKMHGGLGVSLSAAEHVVAAGEKGELQVVSIQFSPERSGLAVSFAKGGNSRSRSLVDGTGKAEGLALGAAKLAQALCSCLRLETLRELELVGLRLTHEFYRALNKALLSNSSLKVLCLNDTDVGDKGIAMLLPGIKEHATLSRIQLCNTNITDVGGRQVVEMLREQAERLSQASWRHSLRTSVSKSETDKGLKVIALSYNALGDDTLSMLTSVLSLDSCLCEIYLRGSRMSEKASIQLQAALLDNMRLQTLDVRDTDETSTASGWLWDASQDPPLIMQQFLPPRPMDQGRETKQMPARHEGQPRRVHITGEVSQGGGGKSVRPTSAPNGRNVVEESQGKGRLRRDGNSGDSRTRMSERGQVEESMLDPDPSWSSGFQTAKTARGWIQRKAHSTADAITRRVHMADDGEAMMDRGSRGPATQVQLRDKAKRIGRGGPSQQKGLAGESARAERSERLVGTDKANGVSKMVSKAKAEGGVVKKSGKKSVQSVASKATSELTRGGGRDDVDRVLSSLVRGLKELVSRAPIATDDSSVERRRSFDDGVASFVEQAQSRRPIRDTHTSADALIDATTCKTGGAHSLAEMSSDVVKEEDVSVLVSSLRETLRCQVFERQRAEAKNLELVVENAALRRQLQGRVGSGGGGEAGAARGQGKGAGKEEERLLIELEETIYMLSNKVRELEEGKCDGSSLGADGQGAPTIKDSRLGGYAGASSTGTSALVAQRLKHMWGST